MNKRWNKNIFLLMFSLLFVVSVLVGCTEKEDETNDKEPEQTEQEETDNEQSDNETGTDEDQEEKVVFKSIEEIEAEHDSPIPKVTMSIKDRGDIIIHLYPDIAPNTVNSFISLIEDGFYDELIFHRVVPGFVIQGGDPEGTGMGGPGYAIKGEFYSNGFENTLIHERGVLSMARSGHPDSAGSQFFIVVADAPHLNSEYAAFGSVVEGIDIADEIVSVDSDELDKPLEDQIIESVTVDLNGYEAEAPNKIEE